MKTLKFALIAAIVACTMVSLAKADGINEHPKFKKIVNKTLDEALKVPGLAEAMYAQIDRDEILGNPTSHVYVASVAFQGNTYRITGTISQWLRFFRMQGISPVHSKLKSLKTL